MSRYRKITTICCAAVFALGLSACGGGDDGISVADRDAAVNDAVDAEKAKTEALQKEIDALRAQLELEDDGNVGNSVAALQAEVMRLKGLVDAAEKAENAEATKAMIATATALKMAIDGRNAAATEMHGDKGLNVDPDGNGEMDDVTLKAGMGMSYSHMNAAKTMSYDAMVYSDRGMPTMKKFSEQYATPGGSLAYDKDTRTLSGDFSDTGDSNIGGSMFPTVGTKTYAASDGATERSVPGTYDGAMGTYFCTGDACSARYTSDGIVLAGTGATWRFVHAKDAMVSRPDPDYLYYGWWVQKDKDGNPTATNVFAMPAGTAPDSPDVGHSEFQGDATYMGSAAGKYAMTNTAAGTAEGGHFTANVTLNAKFGNGDDAGISGTVNNFMAGDESKPWSVALAKQKWTDGGATIAANMNDDDTATMTTVWSINGNKAAASGKWGGEMYDTAANDDSNVPTDVIGTFESMFGESGSMIGAFGAKKQ